MANPYLDLSTAFSSNYDPGTVLDWHGGQLSFAPTGDSATYYPSGGMPYEFSASTPLWEIGAAIPSIIGDYPGYESAFEAPTMIAPPTNAFDPSQYIGQLTGSQGGTGFMGAGGELFYPTGEQFGWQAGNTLYDMAGNVMGSMGDDNTWSGTSGSSGTYSPYSSEETFEIPTDVYPYATSDSYGGLPSEYIEQLLSSLMPQLVASIEALPGSIDEYTQAGLGAYDSAMRGVITQSMPSILNEIFGRNMQESSIAGDVTQGMMSDYLTTYAPLAYQTAMTGAQMQANLPSLLADIAGLGITDISQTDQADPLAPYIGIADLINALY